ncbi:hypothetical protein BH11BAC3_BH11BAC3_14500 [soil metagenome]
MLCEVKLHSLIMQPFGLKYDFQGFTLWKNELAIHFIVYDLCMGYMHQNTGAL